MRILLITVSLAALSGCTWMQRQADAIGQHMPVIGERCENWQCVTSSGQARSDMNKTMREKQEESMKASQSDLQTEVSEQPDSQPVQNMPAPSQRKPFPGAH